MYLYRAVDKRGLTVDFLLSEHRDIAAAKRFFIRAIERHGAPDRITLDGYPATHSAVAELKKSGMLRPQTKVRTSKYLNNIAEQDHRRVKQRMYPMLGFKQCRNAAVTISGIRAGAGDQEGAVRRFTGSDWRQSDGSAHPGHSDGGISSRT